MIFLIIIPFLILGCAVFLVCVAMPPLRRYALSASLWCIALTPWLFALIIGIFVCTVAFGVTKNLLTRGLTDLLSLNLHSPSRSAMTIFEYLFLTLAVVGSLITASVVAILHQVMIHRLTLALFRLYAAAVAFGVGILTCSFALNVWGQSSVFWNHPFMVGVPSGLIVSIALAMTCYRFAVQLRGRDPARFPFVTRQEFFTDTMK